MSFEDSTGIERIISLFFNSSKSKTFLELSLRYETNIYITYVCNICICNVYVIYMLYICFYVSNTEVSQSMYKTLNTGKTFLVIDFIWIFTTMNDYE